MTLATLSYSAVLTIILAPGIIVVAGLANTLIKNIVVISLTVCAVGVTVRASTYVARQEGLMGPATPGGS